MGGVCMCWSWTCRPVWPVFIILVLLPCMLDCAESPAAAGGKMYPRGNHWAVGHLMGKKSLPELRETNYITPSETAGVTDVERFKGLMEALMQQKKQNQMKPQTADRLHRRWREEDRDKYLREMSKLLLLALKLQDNDST